MMITRSQAEMLVARFASIPHIEVVRCELFDFGNKIGVVYRVDSPYIPKDAVFASVAWDSDARAPANLVESRELEFIRAVGLQVARVGRIARKLGKLPANKTLKKHYPHMHWALN